MPKAPWENLKIKDSTVSLFLGILVVIVIGALLFNYIGRTRKAAETSQTSTQETTEEQPTTTLPTKYTVVEGDDLWKIAEKHYKSGYNWVDIARENNLVNPNLIAVGQELTIPKAETILPATGEVASGETVASITGSSYTVVRDDDLWDIAVRAYGDGFKWVEIAKANNLAEPNIIHPGNVLTLPR